MSDTIETQLQKTYNEIFEMKDELLQKEMADLKEKIEHNRASLELVHNQLQTNIYPILSRILDTILASLEREEARSQLDSLEKEEARNQ